MPVWSRSPVLISVRPVLAASAAGEIDAQHGPLIEKITKAQRCGASLRAVPLMRIDRDRSRQVVAERQPEPGRLHSIEKPPAQRTSKTKTKFGRMA